MSREDVKKSLLNAIKNSPFRSDIGKALLFGSYARGDNKEESDIDVLVEFKPHAKIGLFKLVRLQRILSEATGKKVDLLTPQGLSKFFKEDVMKEAELIYEE